MSQDNLKLTSTQIGAIAENIVASTLMSESSGRLSPFWPVADDDGIDLLIYDKVTGEAIPVQVKSRTKALKKSGRDERGNIVHFEVRTKTIKQDKYAHLIAVLLSEDFSKIDCAWFIPMTTVITEAREGTNKYVIRPSRSRQSKDRFSKFRCNSSRELVTNVIKKFKQK